LLHLRRGARQLLQHLIGQVIQLLHGLGLGTAVHIYGFAALAHPARVFSSCPAICSSSPALRRTSSTRAASCCSLSSTCRPDCNTSSTPRSASATAMLR